MQIVNTVVYVRSYLGLAEEWVAIVFAAAGTGSTIGALTLPGLGLIALLSVFAAIRLWPARDEAVLERTWYESQLWD